jgi:glycosyltransferase involved in cell wall biosynthesis
MLQEYNHNRILFCAPLPPPTTGQSLACALLIKSLIKNSEVQIVNLSKPTFRQGINSLKRVNEIFKIFFKVDQKKALSNILYFTVSESIAGNLKDLVIYAICWRQLDRMVIHLHGGAGMRVIMSSKHPLLRALNSFFLKRLGAVIVLGDRLRSIYEGMVPPSRLHAVPNFSEDEFFVPPKVIDEKFASVEPLRLLFLSNLLPGKGHMELLVALSQLAPEVCQRLHVDFAGGFESTEDEARFRKQAKAIKHMQINVHGIVHGEHKRDLLRKAHLFCLPTYYPYEGQPISILEAYASGCAVMTTDHSGIFDTFTPGVNGIEVKPRSPDSIAQAIEHALANTHELCGYAKHNLQQAQQKYRASTHVEALEKIIFSVA